MSSKGSLMMKSAQHQKTKQAVQQLVEWYSSKQDFYKVYLPIQQTIIKKIFNATQITLGRLKDFAHYFAEEKQINAAIYQKSEKSVICDESKYQPKTEQANDPKNSKGPKPPVLELPAWSHNIDRVLIALSRNQKQKKGRLKKVHKILETIHDSLAKEQAKYKGQLRKFQKQLESTFDRIDQLEKQQSKRFAKILKQSKSEQMKDSSFFIGQIKKMERYIATELQLFANRGKTIVDMIQALLKLEKEVSKKIKDQLIAYRNCKQSLFGSDMKGQQDIWGQVSLLEEKIQVQRVTYFNKALLRTERIQDLKKIMTKLQAKNNWQTIIGFLSATKEQFSEIIKAEKTISQLLKTISYRCWPNIALAEGWLIQTYTPTVMYMTYDSIMLIYNKQGQCLKKINTGSSKVSKVQGNTIFLSQKIKGFFSDSVQEYKIRFQEVQRMQQFQLFIQNQIT